MLGLDVHLQAIATGGPVATLLTDKQLLSAVLESFMKAQLCPGQEALGAGGTLAAKEIGWEQVRRQRVCFLAGMPMASVACLLTCRNY